MTGSIWKLQDYMKEDLTPWIGYWHPENERLRRYLTFLLSSGYIIWHKLYLLFVYRDLQSRLKRMEPKWREVWRSAHIGSIGDPLYLVDNLWTNECFIGTKYTSRSKTITCPEKTFKISSKEIKTEFAIPTISKPIWIKGEHYVIDYYVTFF